VLLAGISGFKTRRELVNPSARLLRDWIERGYFTWLITEEIVAEYKGVLARKRVGRALIGGIINLLREEAEMVTTKRSIAFSPDPGDDPLCVCAEVGGADFIVTLNTKDFPQDRLTAKVISPGDPLPFG
jgi:hypothetical protein